MTNEEMTKEMKENNIEDNPFDVMLHHALEISRDLLFASQRYKNPEVPQSITVSKELLEKRMDMIYSELDKVDNISDDTVKICRETSAYSDQRAFRNANETLLRMENKMPTAWSRIIPAHNDDFEKIRLGEDSAEYKRISQLREIIDSSELLSCVNDKYLNSLVDVIERPDDCVPSWMTKQEFEMKKSIIETFNLTVNDIKYMVSYKFNN